MTSSEVFVAYVAACTAKDLERAVSFYTQQSVYHNLPTEPVHGVDGVRKILSEFFAIASAIRFEIHAIAETPSGEVLTRRTDHFCINDTWVSVEVMGAVSIRQGKILVWREYFDSRQMEAGFAKASGALSTATSP
jgi:limonene-1,2-epoxide hydrolase